MRKVPLSKGVWGINIKVELISYKPTLPINLQNLVMEYIAHGIVLQAQNSKDTDRLYSIFALEKGLIKAIAKSVRKSKSKLSGFLIPSNQVILMLANGKSTISKIAQVKILKTYSHIVNNYENFLLFSQVAEILLNFLRDNLDEKDIYDITLSFLDDLDNEHFSIEKKRKIQLLYFSELLEGFGFKPNKIELNGTVKKFLDLVFKNSYSKNRDLMLKLKLEDNDFKQLINWFKNYFQNILEKELNSF